MLLDFKIYDKNDIRIHRYLIHVMAETPDTWFWACKTADVLPNSLPTGFRTAYRAALEKDRTNSMFVVRYTFNEENKLFFKISIISHNNEGTTILEHESTCDFYEVSKLFFEYKDKGISLYDVNMKPIDLNKFV